MRHNGNNDLLTPERVLFISAHPDDPDFGAGGTTALWVRSGAKVVYVIVTDGAKGSNDPELTGEQLARIRQDEQRAAAQRLGVSVVVFLGYPDGEVYNTPKLRCDLVRQVRLHRPDIVVTHDPTARFIGNSWINHPDHRAVGDAALDAVFPLARGRLNFPEHEREGLNPHKVLNVLMTPTNEPNEWLDISATLDVKIAALWEHRSQIGDPQVLEKRIRQRAQDYAEDTTFAFAERFRRLTLSR
jgi:LmbE family N-acetylglucosaminyl deacetylase